MPTKEPIELDKGTIYISQEGEAPVPLDGIQEVTLEPATGGVVDPEDAFDGMVRKMSALELALHVDFTPLTEAVNKLYENFKKAFGPLLLCKNRRLLYLATHGKPRVRKKNIKRIMRGD